MDSIERKAAALLKELRSTAMRRGAITQRQARFKTKVAFVLKGEGLPAELSGRIALQLAYKFDPDELNDYAVWRAIGQQLTREAERLRTHVGLAERQIVKVLPKLSPAQVEGFLAELRMTDRRIARTILNAAIEGAEPLSTGRRYLAEYRAVAEQLRHIDQTVARTLANASFTARAPRKKAMEHFRRFADLVKQFDGDVDFARRLARAVFRAPDPLRAAHDFIAGYQEVVAVLTATGVQPPIARTLACSRRLRARFRSEPVISFDV